MPPTLPLPLHLAPQPLRLLPHDLLTPRLPTLLVNLGHLRPLPPQPLPLPSRLPSTLLQMPPHIPLLPLQHPINGIVLQILRLPRNYVHMHVRHALARVEPVLHGDVKGRGLVDALDHFAHGLNGGKEVG